MPSQNNNNDQNSYQTHRSQFIRDATSRTSNTSLKDEDFLNCIFESIKNRQLDDNRQFIMKRAGAGQQIASVAASEVRGMYYWDDKDKLYYAVGTSIYIYNFNTSSLTSITPFGAGTGEVGFTEYLYDTNTVVIIATDGTTLVRITDTDTFTTCADADLPAPHLPFPVFLDGYLFLAKKNTADVYNSDLNDPFSWTPGNLIAAEMRADLVQRICVLNNYLVVFGTRSIEYFWDAANATGTPMQRNDTPIKLNLYLGGFAQYGNDIYFLGENLSGQPEVFRLSDFKLEGLANYTVSRYLNTVTESIASWEGAILTCQGHAIYLVSAGTLTYACDVENKFWTRWSWKDTDSFSIVHSSRATTATQRRSIFALKGSDSTIYYLSDTLYQDVGVNFKYRIVTEASDYGTLNRKMMARFSLIGDRTDVDSNFSLYWSDDDYQTYHGPRTINISQDLPSTYRLGWFRQRIFKIEYTDNYPFRLQHFEVDINKGLS